MDELYSLFFENLSDGIPSVRQGAAMSLANVVKAYGRYWVCVKGPIVKSLLKHKMVNNY